MRRSIRSAIWREASNRYHMMFAETSHALWRLAEHEPYLNYVRAVHGTDEVCLHRSAAILRTAGEGMGHVAHRSPWACGSSADCQRRAE